MTQPVPWWGTGAPGSVPGGTPAGAAGSVDPRNYVPQAAPAGGPNFYQFGGQPSASAFARGRSADNPIVRNPDAFNWANLPRFHLGQGPTPQELRKFSTVNQLPSPDPNSGVLSGPGAAESYYAANMGRFTAPTATQKFQEDIVAHPEHVQDPNLAAYYANAGRQATEAIDTAAAARGSYGSSAALDLNREALTNLAAERAKNEAQLGLDWTRTMGNLASSADTSGLSYLTGGMGAAEGAQGAQRSRYNDMFNNEMKWGDAMSGITGTGYSDMFNTDRALMEDQFGSGVARATDAQNNARYETGQNRQNTVDLMALIKSIRDQTPSNTTSGS